MIGAIEIERRKDSLPQDEASKLQIPEIKTAQEQRPPVPTWKTRDLYDIDSLEADDGREVPVRKIFTDTGYISKNLLLQKRGLGSRSWGKRASTSEIGN